jgi:hypothetical protein
MFVRNERDLPVPRSPDGRRRPAGVDGEIVLLDLDSSRLPIKPWCAKCRRPLAVPRDVAALLRGADKPPPIYVPCDAFRVNTP